MTEDKSKLRVLSYDDWIAEGTELFGDDKLQWEFVCPACGHIQKPIDFKPYQDAGANPSSAAQSCIGRFDGHMHVDMGTGNPCNYTAGGVKVVFPDGHENPVFGFNYSETPGIAP
ncbi:MAG: hypothetical protein JXR84_15285 [Anaerolineae bacterium]|nr:hypothetical protein [Anaerolineae bacterium]